KHLTSGGFNDPSSPSSQAQRQLRTVFHSDEPNLVLLVTARQGDVDSPAVTGEGNALTNELARTPGVGQAVSYWSLGSPPPLRSHDGHQALVLARIAGTDDQVRDRMKQLSPAL